MTFFSHDNQVAVINNTDLPGKCLWRFNSPEMTEFGDGGGFPPHQSNRVNPAYGGFGLVF
jgi:hypothetical protein